MRGWKRWLLIFDNAEDPSALAPCLPGGRGHVLITSRNPDWHELARPVVVDVFERAESVSVLRARVAGLSEPDANRVAEALEDLPLAVQQAAAFLAESGTAAGEYRDLLASRAMEVLALGRPVGYPASLAASWQLALDRLAVDAPAGLMLLVLAAQLAPEPIPLTLFTAHPDRLPEPLATAAADPLGFAKLMGRAASAGVGPSERRSPAAAPAGASHRAQPPAQQPRLGEDGRGRGGSAALGGTPRSVEQPGHLAGLAGTVAPCASRDRRCPRL